MPELEIVIPESAVENAIVEKGGGGAGHIHKGSPTTVLAGSAEVLGLSGSSALASSTSAEVDEKHRQNWYFEFIDRETEARFIEFRYSPAGLFFPCVCGIVVSFALFLVTQMNFQADIFHDNITTWFFTKPSWATEDGLVPRLLFGVNAVLMFLTGLCPIVYYFCNGKPRVPGKILEVLWVLPCVYMVVLHYSSDYRYIEYCQPGQSPSLVMRDATVVDHCEDFFEPYNTLQLIVTFVLPTRIKLILIFVYPFSVLPFFSRKVHPFNYDYLFRTSDALWFFNCLIYLIGFAAYDYALRRQFIQHEIVQQEVEETKRAQSAVSRLLDAMLPASVLKRLIANEEISDSGVVSVVFSDVAGFTAWCSAQKAEAVVSMLNTMYTHFDGGLKRYNIEKVKTIGDAYWAICGLPDVNPEHILNICAFAKFMLRCVARMGENNPQHKVHIRIGVTTGNVCGGLVGSHQSTYDMFGTTNEVAELMEQRAPVDGILISEESYRRLKIDHKMMDPDGNTGEIQCVVELQDEAIETVQGKMATYVLKTFGWMPGDSPVSDEAIVEGTFAKNPETNTADGEEANPEMIKRNKMDLLRRTDSNLSSHAESHPQHLTASFATTPLNRSGEGLSRSIEIVSHSPSHDHRVAEDARTPESSVYLSTPASRTDQSSSVEVDVVREQLSKATHMIHHTFDDEGVEAEFQQFMHAVFPHKFQVVSSMLGALLFLIYVVMLAEGRSHPWYTHLLLIFDLLATVFQFFLVGKVAIHPVAGLVAFYSECAILLVALAVANRSVVSNDLLYLTFNFTYMCPSLGYIGGGMPYLLLCLTNILFLFTPSLVAQIIFKTMFIHHLIAPPMFVCIWVIALRNSEMGQREQFINMKLADVALEQTRTEHEKVSELLGRMVPRFIVDELTVWFCGPRDTMIAANFPLVGILFARVPALHEQFSDSTIDPLTVMGLIGNYATVCDSILHNFPECTKLKIIGDILMFASGLSQHKVLQDEQRAKLLRRKTKASKKRPTLSRKNSYMSQNSHNNSKFNEQCNSESDAGDLVSQMSASGQFDGSMSQGGVEVASVSDQTPITAFGAGGISSSNNNGLMTIPSPSASPLPQLRRKSPLSAAPHLVELASLALALASQVQTEFQGAAISAGMHCGNATAGIIGNDRLIYDVFGDTVNTASRVMSTSGEGVWASVKFSTKVGSSGSTGGTFFGAQEERQMKGKGTMHVVSVSKLPD